MAFSMFIAVSGSPRDMLSRANSIGAVISGVSSMGEIDIGLIAVTLGELKMGFGSFWLVSDWTIPV